MTEQTDNRGGHTAQTEAARTVERTGRPATFRRARLLAAILSVPVGLVIAGCSSTSSPATESSAFMSVCAGPNPLDLPKSPARKSTRGL